MPDTGELSAAMTTISNPVAPSRLARSSYRKQLLFGLVLVLSGLYLARELRRTWIPADDGALAESAECVLQGALPHRDFHEIYTGLLSYLNAASFRAFGTNLASMRYMLFLFCLAWIPSHYYVA